MLHSPPTVARPGLHAAPEGPTASEILPARAAGSSVRVRRVLRSHEVRLRGTRLIVPRGWWLILDEDNRVERLLPPSAVTTSGGRP